MGGVLQAVQAGARLVWVFVRLRETGERNYTSSRPPLATATQRSGRKIRCDLIFGQESDCLSKADWTPLAPVSQSAESLARSAGAGRLGSGRPSGAAAHALRTFSRPAVTPRVAFRVSTTNCACRTMKS